MHYPSTKGTSPVSNITELASAQITASDAVVVVLSEPDDMPASVIVHWPLNPSVIAPKRFPDVAAVVVRLFSEAHISLARIRVKRRR
jgi:hypothetical protein